MIEEYKIFNDGQKLIADNQVIVENYILSKGTIVEVNNVIGITRLNLIFPISKKIKATTLISEEYLRKNFSLLKKCPYCQQSYINSNEIKKSINGKNNG